MVSLFWRTGDPLFEIKKEGVGVSGRKVQNGRDDRIDRELAEAIRTGKAPQFEVQSFDFHNSLWTMGSGKQKQGEKRLRMTLSLLLDGQSIIHAKEQTVNKSRRGLAYEGRMGSVDIMETALREAIVLRWPEMGLELVKIKTGSYAVHAIGATHDDGREDCHVQVHLRVIVEGCQEACVVSREGVDSIGITLDALLTIYHWFSWRALRRLRGEAREKKRS